MPTLPRSLADDLRARSDDDLVALLAARPDLLNPVPSDVTALAARSTTRPSVQRALEALDLFTLQVVEVLCALPDPVPVERVGQLLGADAAEPLSRLRTQALVYGSQRELLVVRTVREVMGAPAGLGPAAEDALRGYGPARLERLLADLGLPAAGDPAEAVRRVAAALSDGDRVDALLIDAPTEVRDALQALTWGPPSGRVERAAREVDLDSARSPVEWLLARGLLVAADATTVVLPREVALHLRGGRVHRAAATVPPALESVARDPDEVDRTATGQVLAVVRLVEDLLEAWATDPPRVLRTGGIGVRDRNRAAATLDVDETLLALLVETAHGAGLLAAADDPEEVWLPTPAYDGWLTDDPARRWAVLATAWLDTTRVPGLVGRRDERDRVLAPLGPGLDRVAAPQVRAAALAATAEAGPGAAPSPGSVVERLRWHAPGRGGRLRAELVTWTLREAEVLGLLGRGALTSYGRAVLDGDQDGAVGGLTALLPEPLDHVLLQADLTAVAPGPLTADLTRRLRFVADVESTGGATVYRFSDATVRRALDAGWSAAEVLDLLTRHSRTPVPQPLSYLVEDVARRHGRVRVGAASSYVRCDDEATVAAIVADRRAEGLRLRRLAPTVLAAGAPADVVLSRLRELGLVPAAESPDGAVLVHRPDARRARPVRRPPRLVTTPTAAAPPALLAAAVRAVRGGDRGAARVAAGADESDGPPGTPLRRSTADVLAMLAQAVAAGTPLWIGYVSAEGRASNRVIEPVGLDGGYVSAYDHLRDEVRTFAVHRITGISVLNDPAPPADPADPGGLPAR